ncbi:hypothetical protein H4I96_04254 [Botrytis cinerea]
MSTSVISASGDEAPYKDDLGSDYPQNIIYASFKSKKIPDKFKDRLDTQAGIHVKDRKKEGELPKSMDEDARSKRSLYSHSEDSHRPHCANIAIHRTREDLQVDIETVTQTQNTSESHVFWSLIQVFIYDKMRDEVQATLRCVTYNLTQDTSEVVVGKSGYEKIGVCFHYNYADYDSNEETWNAVEPKVDFFILILGKVQTCDTIKIPV